MKTLLTAAQLEEGVDRLGAEIGHFYRGESLTIIGVLTGSIVLLADLIRRLSLPLRVGFVQASSYRGPGASPGKLIVNEDLLLDIRGRHTLLVDDIYDTGVTLHELLGRLRRMEPASLRSAVLLRKHGRKLAASEPDHVGFEIPNEFVVGYGLDYQDAYRNLPYVAALEAAELSPTD